MDIIYTIILLIIVACIHNTKYTNVTNYPLLRLKFKSKFYLPSRNMQRHNMISIQQFIDYFLPTNYQYVIVNDYEKSDITICDIYLENSNELRDDEINILISVENITYWKFHKHYMNYNEYNNNKISIYLYNHINKIHKTNNYLAIPLIHNYINYFININTIIFNDIIY